MVNAFHLETQFCFEFENTQNVSCVSNLFWHQRRGKVSERQASQNSGHDPFLCAVQYSTLSLSLYPVKRFSSVELELNHISSTLGFSAFTYLHETLQTNKQTKLGLVGLTQWVDKLKFKIGEKNKRTSFWLKLDSYFAHTRTVRKKKANKVQSMTPVKDSSMERWKWTQS